MSTLFCFGDALQSRRSAAKVVTLFEIRDQCGMHRPPAQPFPGPCARRRIVCRCEGAEPAEVGFRLFAGNAGHRQVQVAVDIEGSSSFVIVLAAAPFYSDIDRTVLSSRPARLIVPGH
ncbi:hypothetical protein LJK87_48040 [Paenibacillus sp. P25]|nr:hypothetical protein LJK87_48040 [Paenibacillus sp. P25]